MDHKMSNLNATTHWTVRNVAPKLHSARYGHFNSTTKWHVYQLQKDIKQRHIGKPSGLNKCQMISTAKPDTVLSADSGDDDCKLQNPIVSTTDTSDTHRTDNFVDSQCFKSHCQVRSSCDQGDDCCPKSASELKVNRFDSQFDGMDRCSEDEIEDSESSNHIDMPVNCETDKNAVLKEEVPVQQWDQYVKDLSKSINKTDRATSASSSSAPSRWDGSRKTNSADVVAALLKEKSSGFGQRVFTWDGSHSVLGEDKIRTRNPNEKRQWLEEYEEELDRGKVKKIKKKQPIDFHGSRINVFQSYQNYKNMDTKETIPIHCLRS